MNADLSGFASLFFITVRFMKIILLSIAAIIFISPTAFAQDEEIITVFETVRIKNDKRAEALFYYENNWKTFRDTALEKGYIHSYELIETGTDEKAAFDLVLITRYAGKKQFEKSEENFRKLIEASGGVKLLNELKPNEFRENVFVVTGRSIAGQGQTLKKIKE